MATYNIEPERRTLHGAFYLPIPVPGALFSVGDGHAVQGDGEVCSTAIESPMERVSLTFRLRDDWQISWPRANPPAGWLTIACTKRWLAR